MTFALARIDIVLLKLHGCGLDSCELLLKHYRLLMHLDIFEKDNFAENFLFPFADWLFCEVFLQTYMQIRETNIRA